MYFVYREVDQRNRQTIYVGITNDPNARHRQHLQGKGPNQEMNTLVLQCLADGIKPKMEIIEIVDDKPKALEREAYWIKYYEDQGTILTNIHKKSTMHYNTIVKRQKANQHFIPRDKGTALSSPG